MGSIVCFFYFVVAFLFVVRWNNTPLEKENHGTLNCPLTGFFCNHQQQKNVFSCCLVDASYKSTSKTECFYSLRWSVICVTPSLRHCVCSPMSMTASVGTSPSLRHCVCSPMSMTASVGTSPCSLFLQQTIHSSSMTAVNWTRTSPAAKESSRLRSAE